MQWRSVLNRLRMNAWQIVRIFALVLALSPFPAQGSNRELFPDPSQAKADIAAALTTAAQTHKRVLLDFGGDWCGDCQVLDIYFHNPQNLPVLEANFVLVHINIGHMDINQDIARHYQVPLDRGVPAVA